MKGMAFNPGVFRFHFLRTAFLSCATVGGERSNLNLGLMGLTQPRCVVLGVALGVTVEWLEVLLSSFGIECGLAGVTWLEDLRPIFPWIAPELGALYCFFFCFLFGKSFLADFTVLLEEHMKLSTPLLEFFLRHDSITTFGCLVLR